MEVSEPQSILYVDIGNTHINLEYESHYFTTLVEEFDLFNLPKHNQAIISNNTHKDYITYFTNPVITQTKAYKSLQFDYDIKQLGIDRYHSIIALYERYSHAVVIDMGTAITIDKIEQGKHTSLGITPGFKRMLGTFSFVGEQSQTQFANGCSSMIEKYIVATVKEYSSYPVIITGGDYARVEHLLDSEHNMDYQKNMVIDGLKFYFNTFIK